MIDEHGKASNVRTPTGRGTQIDLELPMRSILTKREISKISFLISPTSPRDAKQGFRLTRTTHYDDRPAPTKQTSGRTYATPEAALNEVRGWLLSAIRPREKAPTKRSLIEAGGYYEGGRDGQALRKVVAFSGGMVHWCDFAGMGSCWDTSFATWMKRKTDTPDPAGAKRIERALAESGVTMESMQLAAALMPDRAESIPSPDDDSPRALGL